MTQGRMSWETLEEWKRQSIAHLEAGRDAAMEDAAAREQSALDRDLDDPDVHAAYALARDDYWEARKFHGQDIAALESIFDQLAKALGFKN